METWNTSVVTINKLVVYLVVVILAMIVSQTVADFLVGANHRSSMGHVLYDMVQMLYGFIVGGMARWLVGH